MLVLDGRPVELNAHLARLESSLETLFPDRTPADLSQLDVPSESGRYGSFSDGTSGAGEGDALHGIRVTVAPDAGSGLEARTLLRAVERQPALGTSPISLHSLAVPGGLGPHKWVDRTLLDEAQAPLPEGALPLLVDEDGSVLEASRANVFAVRDDVLLTPPLDGRILPGVTRMRVLELAATGGLETDEIELSVDDLLAADEVFLTGSVRGVERVRALDGTALRDDGEVTSQIAAELRQAWLDVQVG